MVIPFASARSVKQNPEAAPKPGTRNPGGPQFAPLAQIRAANVHTLEPAWTYRTRDASERW
jgi:glucose dehydrogenase